jgi:transaldolase
VNPLQQLGAHGQSVWYDNISRMVLTDGSLRRLIEAGEVQGVTSNPTIFEKAIGGSTAYDADIRRYRAAGLETMAIYENLAIEDIRAGADLLRPVFERTAGLDGYISLEVAPNLAYDSEATVRDAVRLWTRMDRPNIMIKIPATEPGWTAIEECIARGLNINVTMMFSLRHFSGVTEAYLRGLSRRLAAGQDVRQLRSVASVFVSRFDVYVDPLLERKIAEAGEGERARLRGLLGKAALANAKLTYARFREVFSGSRWATLSAAGANVQRLLWASTSTKNPAYRDVLYAEQLIGPDTIDTMPPATLDAFRDHGVVARTVDLGLAEARQTVAELRAVGIDLEEVGERLQEQGVQRFAEDFRKMLSELEAKARELAG